MISGIGVVVVYAALGYVAWLLVGVVFRPWRRCVVCGGRVRRWSLRAVRVGGRAAHRGCVVCPPDARELVKR